MTERRKYHTLVPSVYILLRKGGKVLLLRRANTNYRDGWYCLPAGHVEPGEPAHLAAVREAKEEAGITIKPVDLRLAHVMQRVAFEGGYERIDLVFEATRWSGEPENMEPQKCDDMQWFSVGDLPDKTIPNIRNALQYIDDGVRYSTDNYSGQ